MVQSGILCSKDENIMNIGSKKERLYAELKVGILEGKFSKKFPPEPEFARKLKVSRNTLRSVYALLEADGLIVRHSGNGTLPCRRDADVRKNVLFVYTIYPKHFTVDFITPSILQGVEKALPPEWGLESCPVSHLKELPVEKALQILKARNICGIVLQDSHFIGNEAILQIIRQSGIPAVICYCHAEDFEITKMPVVAKSIRQAWLAGLDFLRDSGHEKVVTLNSESEKIREHFSLEEYLTAQKQRGLSPDPELILDLPLDDEVIFESFKRLKKEYTAVYCYSDFYAQSLYRALNKLGRRVPEDVSGLGFCGFCGGAYFNPPLTTVELDYPGIGKQAMEILKLSSEWFNKGKALLPVKYTTFTIRKRESFLQLK